MAGDKFYITVAIDYANAEPHVGHAYEKVTADVLARYHRLKGRDVHYLMGNDEHSANVERRAREVGLDPSEYCDRMARVFRRTWDLLDISYDTFMQTTGPDHVRAVTAFVDDLYKGGHIYRGKYTGWYCVSCEAFYAEGDLVAGCCPVHNAAVDYIEEDNWFFRLSAFSGRLKAHIEENPGFIQPESRRREMLNVLEDGLQDISISRAKSAWGVRLPWDESQVVYVWFDALLSYISGIGYRRDEEHFVRYWPADIHFIGKDITRFHTLIWPAMLMAAELPLPETVFAHGFMLLEGKKMSKSTGNVIDPEEFVGTYGSDALRYYLTLLAPFGHDGDFTMEGFIRRVNDDLANDLGNLLSRTTAMIDKFAGGKVPAPVEAAEDGLLPGQAQKTARQVEERMEALELDAAVRSVWDLVHAANKYIEDQAPWSLARDPGQKDRLDTVLYNLAETLRITAILVRPVLVQASGEIWGQLGLGDIEYTRWDDTGWGGLEPGTAINRGQPLFPRLELPQADQETGDGNGAPEKDSLPEVDINHFRSLELKAARVIRAEAIEGSDRLLKVTVDDGDGERTVVAGIAAHYRPGDLKGRTVVIVANLKPARIFGVQSEGMILTAESGEAIRLLTVDGDVPAGSPVS